MIRNIKSIHLSVARLQYNSSSINTGGSGSLYWQYSDVIMSTMASQSISVSIVYLTVCSDPNQRKHQSSASLAFVRGILRWPVNSPHRGPVTRKMFPFDDVIMDVGNIGHLRWGFSLPWTSFYQGSDGLIFAYITYHIPIILLTFFSYIWLVCYCIVCRHFSVRIYALFIWQTFTCMIGAV